MDHRKFLSKEKTVGNDEEQNFPQDLGLENGKTNMELDRIEENCSVMEISNESAEVLPTFDSNFERFPFSPYRLGNFSHILNSGCLFDDVTQISDTQFEETAFSSPMGNDEEQKLPQDLSLEHLEFEETAYLSPTSGIRQIDYSLEGNDIASNSTNTNVPDFFQKLSSSLYQENNRNISFSHGANQASNNYQTCSHTCLEGNNRDPVSHSIDATATSEMNSFSNLQNFEMLNQPNSTATVDPQFIVADGENTVSKPDEVASRTEEYNPFKSSLTMHTEALPVKSNSLLTESLCCGGSGLEQEHNQPSLSEVRFRDNIDTKTHENARVSKGEDDPQEGSSTMDLPVQSQVKDAPFTCDECGKGFSKKRYLTQHSRIHKREKDFSCTTCNKRFPDERNLGRHSRIHTGEKPHKCKVCGKGFAQTGNLNRHFLTHTGAKPHKCDVCDKGFALKETLRRHCRTHTGAKPYECMKCDKKYSRSYNFTKHFRKHTEDEPFKCRICGQIFWDEDSLNRHKAIHR